MEVIAMGLVVRRTQHAIEEAARPAMDFSQELGIAIVAIPVPQYADASSTPQYEAGNVQRIRRGVTTSFAIAAPIDVAAHVAAEMIDAHDRFREVRRRSRLQDMTFPQR